MYVCIITRRRILVGRKALSRRERDNTAGTGPRGHEDTRTRGHELGGGGQRQRQTDRPTERDARSSLVGVDCCSHSGILTRPVVATVHAALSRALHLPRTTRSPIVVMFAASGFDGSRHRRRQGTPCACVRERASVCEREWIILTHMIAHGSGTCQWRAGTPARARAGARKTSGSSAEPPLAPTDRRHPTRGGIGRLRQRPSAAGPDDGPDSHDVERPESFACPRRGAGSATTHGGGIARATGAPRTGPQVRSGPAAARRATERAREGRVRTVRRAPTSGPGEPSVITVVTVITIVIITGIPRWAREGSLQMTGDKVRRPAPCSAPVQRRSEPVQRGRGWAMTRFRSAGAMRRQLTCTR